MHRGEIRIICSEENAISIKIELVDGTVWLTKSEIANILGVFIQSVSANLREIFKSKELFEGLVTLGYNGIRYYNLDVFIALAFRCKGGYCWYFREWLREQAKKPAIQKPQQIVVLQLNSSTQISD